MKLVAWAMQGHLLGDPIYFHCCVEAGSFGGVAPATNAGRLIPCCANWAKRAGHRTPTSWFSKSHLWRGSAKVVARVVPSLYMAFLWAWEAVPLPSKKEVHPWTALLVHNSETSDEVLKKCLRWPVLFTLPQLRLYRANYCWLLFNAGACLALHLA